MNEDEIEVVYDDKFIELVDIDDLPWVNGKVIGFPDYSLTAKIFKKGSKFGIENGRISKLTVTKGGKQIFEYDRGWVKEPKTSEEKEVLKAILLGLPEN